LPRADALPRLSPDISFHDLAARSRTIPRRTGLISHLLCVEFAGAGNPADLRN